MLKVKSFMANNQAILNDGDKVMFQSYDSVIAVVENGEILISDHWDYSKTTTKYLSKFLDVPTAEIKKRVESGQYPIGIDTEGRKLSC